VLVEKEALRCFTVSLESDYSVGTAKAGVVTE
jgi:hypothetical protein